MSYYCMNLFKYYIYYKYQLKFQMAMNDVDLLRLCQQASSNLKGRGGQDSGLDYVILLQRGVVES